MSKKTEQMQEIRNEVTNLVISPFYEYRRANNNYPVLGEGNHDAKIVFVGEAPGKNEAKQGRPFCGSSGKILDELLASIQLPREEVYITNIVKDRPPENRDPLPSEIDLYGPYLDKQIAIIQPDVIATLGRFSMNYIMEKFDLSFEIEPISSAHGKIYEAQASYGTISIIPLYHPAAAIYNQHLKETLRMDFKILSKFTSNQ